VESDRKVDGTSQYDVREEEGVLVECASVMLQLDDVPTESESAAINSESEKHCPLSAGR
jgi:hypothetical protein